jgi:hypothetical protein
MDGTQKIFAGFTSLASHRRPNPGRCDSHQKQSVADPAFGQAHAIWLSPDVALCLDDGSRWALMHHDGRVCATLELRRATRLGPQRAKGMLSRLCCGQKQWLSWSADGASRTPHHQKLCDHPAKPITRYGPPAVHLEVAVGCPAVARSQARRHPFVRPWGSAIGHWSRKQMFQLTMTFAE